MGADVSLNPDYALTLWASETATLNLCFFIVIMTAGDFVRDGAQPHSARGLMNMNKCFINISCVDTQSSPDFCIQGRLSKES